jgi:hypothetical protein
MAKLSLIPSLLILCVSAASGQEAPPEIAKDSKGREIILQCRPQKPLSHTWICTDQNGKEIRNLLIKDRDSK